MLVDCLHSQHNRVIENALRVLALMLKFGEALPLTCAALPQIATRVFKLMRRAGSSQAALELNQACFKVAAVLVRDCPWYAMNENQIRVLLSYVQSDLQTSGKQNLAFGVLKAIIYLAL